MSLRGVQADDRYLHMVIHNVSTTRKQRLTIRNMAICDLKLLLLEKHTI
jgi:hypothetical protein